jgi:ribosomal protein L14E/L6E/L27E
MRVVEYPVEVGRLVKSTAGRDKGRYFLITEIIDENYVHLVDGDLRSKDRPKRKKIKHVKLCPQVITTIAAKLTGGARVFDAEIRSAIRASIGDSETQKGEATCQKPT